VCAALAKLYTQFDNAGRHGEHTAAYRNQLAILRHTQLALHTIQEMFATAGGGVDDAPMRDVLAAHKTSQEWMAAVRVMPWLNNYLKVCAHMYQR
jgi:hypothetical protein